jgi:hypothetical protein
MKMMLVQVQIIIIILSLVFLRVAVALSISTEKLLPIFASNEIFGRSSTTFDSSIESYQILLVLATYVGCIAYFDQPRGEISPLCSKMLVTKPSNIANAGLGLFATSPIPKDTCLGTYPGVLRPLESYVSGKLERYPLSSQYVWRFSDNRMVIDPTDEFGVLNKMCSGGSPDWFGSYFLFQTLFKVFFEKDTMLARANEPPLMSDCNIYVIEDIKQRKVTFLTSRDVFSGEELYLDYGKTYDRTMYSN